MKNFSFHASPKKPFFGKKTKGPNFHGFRREEFFCFSRGKNLLCEEKKLNIEIFIDLGVRKKTNIQIFIDLAVSKKNQC